MSEFYTVPVQNVKTKDSYINPTTTNGTIFSHHSHSDENECKRKKFWHKVDVLQLFHDEKPSQRMK